MFGISTASFLRFIEAERAREVEANAVMDKAARARTTRLTGRASDTRRTIRNPLRALRSNRLLGAASNTSSTNFVL